MFPDHETACPYCRRQMPSGRVSSDVDATEFRCGPCGHRHTLKVSAPGCAFALHPDTIAAAFSSEIKSRWDGLAILNGEVPDEPDDAE